MTAELSTAMPHNGGCVLWVNKAFGKFMGFQEAWWSFFNFVSDTSVYPILITDYTMMIINVDMGQTLVGHTVRFVAILICCLLNITGIQIVGIISVVFSFAIITPFILMALFGIPYLDPSVWLIAPPDFKTVEWGVFITVISWNFTGYDSLSMISGEIENPKKTIIRGMLISIILTTLTYLVPLSILVCVDKNYNNWRDGYFPVLAEKLAGNWLKILVVVGAFISSMGLLNEYICVSSRMVEGWASDDLLGVPFLRKQTRFGTPWIAILLVSTVSFLITLPASFKYIIQIDNILRSLCVFVEYISLLYLRKKEPDMPRPFIIPLGFKALLACYIVPMIFSGGNVVIPLIFNLLILIIVGGILVLGVIGYFVSEKIKEKCKNTSTIVPNIEFSKTNSEDDL